MERPNKNIKDKSAGKTGEVTKIKHPECNITIQERKVVISKKTEKTYKVTVRYIQLTDGEAKTKRAIIERILKKDISNQVGRNEGDNTSTDM